MLGAPSEISDLVKRATGALQKQSFAPLDSHARELRASVWDEIRKLGSKLHSCFRSVNGHPWSEDIPIRPVIRELAEAVGKTCDQLDNFLPALADSVIHIIFTVNY